MLSLGTVTVEINSGLNDSYRPWQCVKGSDALDDETAII